MSFIKYHVKTVTPHTVVKHAPTLLKTFRAPKIHTTTLNHSHPPDLQYTSAVAHHAHTTGHIIDFKSTHILSSLTKSSQLDLTEHAAIKII